MIEKKEIIEYVRLILPIIVAFLAGYLTSRRSKKNRFFEEKQKIKVEFKELSNSILDNISKLEFLCKKAKNKFKGTTKTDELKKANKLSEEIIVTSRRLITFCKTHSLDYKPLADGINYTLKSQIKYLKNTDSKKRFTSKFIFIENALLHIQTKL